MEKEAKNRIKFVVAPEKKIQGTKMTLKMDATSATIFLSQQPSTGQTKTDSKQAGCPN